MKELTQKFFDRHLLAEVSAARLLYSMIDSPEFVDQMERRMLGSMEGVLSDIPDLIAEKQKIDAEDDIAKLVRMLKRSCSYTARKYLREKLLLKEAEAMQLILNAIPKAFNDFFVENLTFLLVECEGDYCGWLMDHYDEIRYPYTRSMLSLVLGFRGDPSVIPFLKEKLEYFEKHKTPQDAFDQAPLLALYKLSERFPEA